MLDEHRLDALTIVKTKTHLANAVFDAFDEEVVGKLVCAVQAEWDSPFKC